MSNSNNTTPAACARSSTPEFEYLLRDLYFRLEERDSWADQSIKYLLFGNGGGVALLMTLIGALGKEGQWVPILLLPLVLFLFGIVCIGFVVLYSAARARAGRRGVRELMKEYLNGLKTYEEVFLEMGTWPSKWKHYSRATALSFSAFVIGIGTSAGIYYQRPVIHRSVSKTDQLACADTGTKTRPQPTAKPTTPPANDPNR